MTGSFISHFEILEKLGEGGMGIVYKARDTRLKRIVALKFLPRGLTANDAERARFLQEAQAAATINHPNVCTIYSIQEHETPGAGSQQFIEMEYVDGATLKQLVPVSDIPTCLRYALQMADALREAHKSGIVHRDIKCENILVNRDGQVKVMDFGLAKLKGSVRLTRTSSTVGTVAYMSPEQIQGAEVDFRSDQFSLGVVLYEMLSGHSPFRGEHEAAMMYSIVNEPPQPLETRGIPVAPALWRIIAKLLSKDPGDRYASTETLVRELRELEANPGAPAVVPPPVSVATPGAPVPAKKRPVLAIAIIAVAVVLAGVFYFSIRNSSASAGQIESIAILPFKNASGDQNTEYLSDGLTEHIINALSKLRKLRVTPRSTSFHYKGKEDDARAIGDELHVQVVLTGRVIQRGEDLNVQVELIDVARQAQLWGEQYTRKISELLTVQDEIERTIAQQLHITVDDAAAFSKHSTENTEAYQLYLRGRFYWDKRTVAGFGKALQYFQQALDLDPNFALAHTGVADCYDLLGLGIYNGLPPGESLPKAKAAIEKAFEIDSTLGEAYTTRGHMNHSYEWDWPRAERDFQRAIALSPKYGTGHVFYAVYLNAVGRPAEAFDQFVTAQQLEPLSLPINTWLGMEYYYRREFDKSIEQIRKAIDIDPQFANAYYMISWVYLAKGMTHEGVAAMQIARDLSAGNPVTIAAMIYAAARDGQRARARALYDTLLQQSKSRYISPHNLAIACLGIGDTAGFYKNLARAVDERAFIVSVGVLRVDPFFDFARHDPRFTELWKKTGLSGN